MVEIFDSLFLVPQFRSRFEWPTKTRTRIPREREQDTDHTTTGRHLEKRQLAI